MRYQTVIRDGEGEGEGIGGKEGKGRTYFDDMAFGYVCGSWNYCRYCRDGRSGRSGRSGRLIASPSRVRYRRDRTETKQTGCYRLKDEHDVICQEFNQKERKGSFAVTDR